MYIVEIIVLEFLSPFPKFEIFLQKVFVNYPYYSQ